MHLVVTVQNRLKIELPDNTAELYKLVPAALKVQKDMLQSGPRVTTFSIEQLKKEGWDIENLLTESAQKHDISEETLNKVLDILRIFKTSQIVIESLVLESTISNQEPIDQEYIIRNSGLTYDN